VQAGNNGFQLGLYVAGDWNQSDQVGVGPADSLCDASFASARIGELLYDGSPSNSPLTGWAKPLWESAGLTAAPRPGTQFDLCWKASVNPVAPGFTVTAFEYTVGI
jgi:hypothetical protein